MATKKTEAPPDAVTARAETAAPGQAAAESVYSAGELAAVAGKVFGTSQDCVTAALKVAGISECTISKAKAIVEAFRKKEVR